MGLKSAAKYTFALIGANAQTVIALCSMFIALLSLAVTIESQQRDAEYKELSIKPIISVAANVSEFWFGYHNSGYGVGIVDRVAFALDGKCYASDKMSDEAFYPIYTKFMEATAIQLNDAMLKVKLKSDVKGIHVTQQF
jgi:hypothetical protein